MGIIERAISEMIITSLMIAIGVIINIVFNDLLSYCKKQFNWNEDYTAVVSGIVLACNLIISFYIFVSMVVRIFNLLTN